MQHVLGSYASRAAAEMAVRALEADGFSIQNIVIADRRRRVRRRVWRTLHRGDGADLRRFVVYTVDDEALSDRARTLLDKQAITTPASGLA